MTSFFFAQRREKGIHTYYNRTHGGKTRTSARKPRNRAYLYYFAMSKAPFSQVAQTRGLRRGRPRKKRKGRRRSVHPAAFPSLLVLDDEPLAARSEGIGAPPADAPEVRLLQQLVLREGLAAPSALQQVFCVRAFRSVFVVPDFVFHFGSLFRCACLRSVHAFNKARIGGQSSK